MSSVNLCVVRGQLQRGLSLLECVYPRWGECSDCLVARYGMDVSLPHLKT
jgi:hypothetical protein